MTATETPADFAAGTPSATVEVATTRSISLAKVVTRSEHDLLGEADIPAEAYWGIHTLRAVENFPITGVPVGHFPDFVRALALVKQAAARANRRLGHLGAEKADAIERACERIARRAVPRSVRRRCHPGRRRHLDQHERQRGRSPTSRWRSWARPKGDYAALHPNDDVNMAQSTNDAYPTALRLAIIFAATPLIEALDELAYAFKAKAVEFADVLKMGRTQLQDAVPMTLGQEFDAFFVTLKEDVARLRESASLFREVNLGATAIGTGINADPRYAALAVEELARAARQPLVPASNLIEATSDMGAFVLFSGRSEARRGQAVEDLQRPAAALERAARRLRGDPAAGGAGRLLDHAGQGQSGDPGGGEPGGVHGHRPRPDGDAVRRGRAASAQRLRADHRLLRAVVAAHPDGGVDTLTHRCVAGHRGRPRALPRPSWKTASAW